MAIASQELEFIGTALAKLRTEVGRAVVGQQEVIDQTLVAFVASGHILYEGLPGLGKTLLARALAQAMSLQFSRVQFTPDLMPSDLTGHAVLEPSASGGIGTLRLRKGPIFTNLLLGDEINRAPAKTQSALLEVMQERQVTLEGQTVSLPQPFMVLATQNPIDSEGTYPLPEAQLDRFLFHVRVGYPSAAEEIEILKRTTGGERPTVVPVFSGRELVQLQDLVRRVPVPEEVYALVVRLVQSTRPGAAGTTPVPDVTEWLQWGAGPRAGQVLILGAKARALLHGRFHAAPEDLRALAPPALRHRLVPGFAAAARGLTADILVERLVQAIIPA